MHRPARAAACALLLALAAIAVVQPAEAQGGAPANCSAANLNNWYGYQYNQAVRTTWDGYSAQSKGVCVMKDGQTPAPASCRFSVEKPWWVPSGNPPSPALCWYGEPASKTVVSNAPAGCFPTVLSARPQYSVPAVKVLWDSYTAQTVGVCESTSSMPQDCRFLVQEAATKWLCWWPAKDSQALKQLLDRSAYQTLADTAIGVDAVCDFVGGGRAVIEFRVDGERVQVLVEGCVVKDIQWLTAPMGCREVDPQDYAALLGQAAIDAARKTTGGACLLPRVAQAGECTTAIPLTAATTLCFYGRMLVLTSSFLDDSRFFVDSTFAAVRSLLNSADLGAKAQQLLCDGHLTLNAAKPLDRVKLKAAQGTLLKDQMCKEAGAAGDGQIDYEALQRAYRSEMRHWLAQDIRDQWAGRETALSQPPDAVEDAVGLRLDLVVPLGGFDPAKVFESYSKPDPTGPFGETLHFGIQSPKGLLPIGPYSDQEAPPESLLDDLDGWDPSITPPPESLLDDVDECRPICSVPPGSGAFQPGGGSYFGGAAAGLGARQDLLGGGLVGGFA